ncbi:MAG: hypothetical protein GEU99_14425 [Luteitalea sp.]|nr:hypothetical protein [Luteitalea sp.]
MKLKYFSCTLLSLIVGVSALLAQTSSPKYRVFMDIAHNQVFWNDPASMEGKDANQVERVKYMTDQIMKTASSLNAELMYLREKIEPEHLATCDLLFIHMPSTKYSPAEVEVITQYVQKGGSLFLVMDVDSWSTLEQTNVNDLIKPFDIQFKTQSPDTQAGGYTKAGVITPEALKISYHGGRIVQGGTPFCFNKQTEDYPFGTFKRLDNGGKVIVMGDGMVSLYMTSWQGVDDYQCGEFMHDVFQWLLE